MDEGGCTSFCFFLYFFHNGHMSQSWYTVTQRSSIFFLNKNWKKVVDLGITLLHQIISFFQVYKKRLNISFPFRFLSLRGFVIICEKFWNRVNTQKLQKEVSFVFLLGGFYLPSVLEHFSFLFFHHSSSSSSFSFSLSALSLSIYPFFYLYMIPRDDDIKTWLRNPTKILIIHFHFY